MLCFWPEGGEREERSEGGVTGLKKKSFKGSYEIKKKPIKSFDNSELISFCYKLIRLLNKIIREKGDTGAKSTHFFSYYL
jgi:hypothetical protein